MIEKRIKKLLGALNPLLILEDLFPHRVRRLVFHMFGSASLILAIVIFFGGEALDPSIKGGFFLCLALTLFLFTLEAYFYSLYARASEGKYLASYFIGEMIFYVEDCDLTKSLLFSDVGDLGMKRLGFDEEEIRKFLSHREIVCADLALESLTEHIDSKSYFTLVYQSDKYLADYLFAHGVKLEDFVGAMLFELDKQKAEIEKERIWSKENLEQIPGIGKNWGYGEVYTLEKYGEDLTFAFQGDYFDLDLRKNPLERLQGALTRGRASNAVIVSDDEYSREGIVRDLAGRIYHHKSIIGLQSKRVFRLNPNLLVDNAHDKISLERDITNLIHEAIHAANIILVIPNISEFVRSADGLGVDVLSVFRTAISSPSIQLIFLDSKQEFNQRLAREAVVGEHFEIIDATVAGDEFLTAVILREVEKIEKTK